MPVVADVIHVHYELSGKTDAPVVMLSHSLGSSLAMWEPQMPALTEHFQVLRYDIRGHGGSEAVIGEYTLDMLGDDALGLMDVLGIERVHWVGLSLGGMIGQNLALRHPKRLRSLSLCATMAAVPAAAQSIWQERIATARDRGMEALAQPTMERWFTAPYRHQDPEAIKRIRQYFLATPVAGYIGCCEAIRQLDYLERLKTVKVPTLIVVGADDPATPVAASEAMQARIKGSRLVVISQAAHLVNVEQPHAFNQALLAFLAERKG
ncbi:MAG: 3-oxoadipate enol-lactonase [Gammaproteobacteria bacterium]